jgi:hypothetical protein
MPSSAAALPITADELVTLRRWAAATQVPAVVAQRARRLLLAGEGVTNTQMAEQLGISRPTVIAWRKRYAREGLTAQLTDRHRRGRPQTVRCSRRADPGRHPQSTARGAWGDPLVLAAPGQRAWRQPQHGHTP